MASSICKNKDVTPRAIYKDHFADLEKLMIQGVGDASLPFIQDYNQGGTLLKLEKVK